MKLNKFLCGKTPHGSGVSPRGCGKIPIGSKVSPDECRKSPQGSKGLPASHYKGQEKEELNNAGDAEDDNEGEEWENRFSFSSPIVSIFFIVVSLFFKGQEERN
jgi:hypothetical protein